jgi:hypothetical protein
MEQDIWDTIKNPNLHIRGTGIQTKGIDTLFNNIVAENFLSLKDNNIIAENFLNLKEERDIQVQEAFRTQNRQDQKRNTSRHIIVKTLNAQKKERILKAVKEK